MRICTASLLHRVNWSGSLLITVAWDQSYALLELHGRRARICCVLLRWMHVDFSWKPFALWLHFRPVFVQPNSKLPSSFTRVGLITVGTWNTLSYQVIFSLSCLSLGWTSTSLSVLYGFIATCMMILATASETFPTEGITAKARWDETVCCLALFFSLWSPPGV